MSVWWRNRWPDCLVSAALRSGRHFTSWSLRGLSGKRGREGSVFLKKRPRKCLNSLRSGRCLKGMPCPVSAGRYQRMISGGWTNVSPGRNAGVSEEKLDLVFEYNTEFHDLIYQLVRKQRPRLFSLIEDMRDYILRYRKRYARHSSGRHEKYFRSQENSHGIGFERSRTLRTGDAGSRI